MAKTIQITAPMFDERELAMVKSVLDSRWVTQGPMVKRFEQAVAAKHDVPFALATTSCTAALHLATLALGLGPGDEVVVPAFTWVTSAHCAEYVGAKVVFADVNPRTFNLDPAAFRAAITPRTRAVVVVHLFGLAAEMDEVLEIARAKNIRVIEDAACAIATRYAGKPVGGLGDLGCFSFHPRKIVTTGEGGAVTTRDAALAEKVGIFRNHGTTPPLGPEATVPQPWTMGRFDHLGFNLRMSDIQAAVGVAQMEKLDALLAERVGRAKRYDESLRGLSGIATPFVPAKCGHTYQSYVLRVLEGGKARRNAIMEALGAEAIQTRPGTHAVHRLGYYAAKYGLKTGDFPNAAEAEEVTITLPIFPGMTDEDQDRVVGALRTALAKGTR